MLKGSAVLSATIDPELTFETTCMGMGMGMGMEMETLAVVEPYVALALFCWLAAAVTATLDRRAETTGTRYLHLYPGR